MTMALRDYSNQLKTHTSCMCMVQPACVVCHVCHGQPRVGVLHTPTLQVCQLEHQLFDSLFPSLSADPGALAPLAEPLCLLLYDHVRPKVVALQGLVPLCEVVDILQGEVRSVWRLG